MDTDELEARLGSLEQFRSSVEYGASFLRFGADISNPALTALVIALAEGEYNGETLSEGTVMLGDNSAGAINFIWSPGFGFSLRRGQSSFMSTQDTTGFLTKAFALYPLEVALTTTTVDLDIGDTTDVFSLVRIVSSVGNFDIQSIKQGSRSGHILFLINDTSDRLRFKNNFYGASPPANYTNVFTLQAGGPDVDILGFSFSILAYVDTNIISGEQWFLGPYNG